MTTDQRVHRRALQERGINARGNVRRWETLPDGSTAVVVATTFNPNGSVISRHEPDGKAVWGQVFSKGHDCPTCAEQHADQVEKVLALMRANPAAYDQRPIWDADGRPHQ